MGTKIEYAVTTPLDGSSSSQQRKRFSVHGVDDWEYFQKSGATKKVTCLASGHLNGPAMDRVVDKYNAESIKRTMQMHEDTFKYQVKELHRLYSVQKRLMEELNRETRYRYPMGTSDTCHSQKQSPTALRILSAREDPNSGECSASCSGGKTARASKVFDLERPAEDGARRGGQMDGPDDDSDVELTLSIGSAPSKKKVKGNHKELDSSASFRADRGGESDPGTPVSGSSGTPGQERKQPHWLFHGLRLK